jgi:hypothetical protein
MNTKHPITDADAQRQMKQSSVNINQISCCEKNKLVLLIKSVLKNKKMDNFKVISYST